MSSESAMNPNTVAAHTGEAMRIYIFASDASPGLRAFGGDLVGSQLPTRFKPWHATGTIAPGQEPPYKFPRQAIEAAIRDKGFQLWRLSKKASGTD
jgi:hypothetical protein